MMGQKWRIVKRYGICCLFLISIFQSGWAQLYAKQAGDYYAFVKNGEYLTPFEYTEVPSILDDVFWVNKGDLYGFVDSNMTGVTDFVYTDVSSFENGFARVSRDSLFGFIDKSGNEICALKFDEVLPFRNGFASVRSDSVWGIINTEGKVPTDVKYDFPLFAVSSQFFIAAIGGKWGVIRNDGSVLYPFEYDFISPDGVGYKKEEKEYLGLL